MATKQKLIFEGDNRTGRAFREIDGSLGKMGKSINGAMSSLKGFAGILSAGLVGKAVKDSLDFADKIGKLNTRLGASTEFLSQMKFAAEQTGVSFETFTMGLQRMQRRVAEAAAGTGEAKGALQELGLSAERLVGLSLDDQFDVISEALNGVGNESDKVRLAMKLFDSEGVALLQTMEGGAEAVRGLRNEANELGATLTSDMVDSATKAKDAIGRIETSIGSLTNELAITLAPGIEAVANGLRTFVTGSLDVARAAFLGLGGAIANIISGALMSFHYVLYGIGTAMDYLGAPGSGIVLKAAAAMEEWGTAAGEAGDNAFTAGRKFVDVAFNFDKVGQAANTATVPVKKLGDAVSLTSNEIASNLDADLENLFKDTELFGGGKAKGKGKATDGPFAGLTESVSGALTNGVMQGGEGMKSAFKGVLASLAQQLLQSSFTQLIKQVFGGGGGFFGGLFGGGGTGGKQAGGQAGPGIYRVGESGPETIAIGQRAMVYANRMNSGGGVNINQTIDARGADPAAAGRIRAALQQSQAETIAAVRELKQRRRL